MKSISRIIIVVMAVLMVSTVAFARSNYQMAAEALSKATGKSVDTIIKERETTDKSFGQMAYEAGVQDKFVAEITALKKADIEVQVKAGKITQQQADQIINRMNNRQPQSMNNQQGCIDGFCPMGGRGMRGHGGMGMCW